MGNRRVPKSGPARPRAASCRNRLLSAMPSSMCWPCDIAQRCAETTFSSRKVSPTLDSHRGRQADLVDHLLQLRRQRGGAIGIDLAFKADRRRCRAGGPHLGDQPRPEPVPLLRGDRSFDAYRHRSSRRPWFFIFLRLFIIGSGWRRRRRWLGNFFGGCQFRRDGLGDEIDISLEGNLDRLDVLVKPDPSIATRRFGAGGEAEIAGGNELGDARPQHAIGIEQPRQGAVEEALSQAAEWPGAAVLESRGPMPVDISRADRFVEQRLGLERRNDVPAQRFVRAGMAGAEIDNLEAVCRPGVGQDDEAISAPHFVFGGPFGAPHFGQYAGAVSPVELGAQHPFVDLTLYPPPGEPQLDSILELSPRLLGAPDKRGRVEAR